MRLLVLNWGGQSLKYPVEPVMNYNSLKLFVKFSAFF